MRVDSPTQYSVLVAAVISAIVQAICTVALERLAKIDLLHAAGLAFVPSIIILAALLAAPYIRRIQHRIGQNVARSRLRGRSDEPVAEYKGSGIPVTKAAIRDEELFDVLSQVGLVEVTGKLAQSQVTPEACMGRAGRALSFLGVLGSKWVNDPPVRARLSAFLASVEAKRGHARFCLINPWGPAYKKLHGFRGGNITWESLRHFRDLKAKHPCLQVRLYDALPNFRLILLDERTCVVARYKIDEQGYFKSKYGWEAPHLTFSIDANWSLYEPFSSYFEDFWSKSKPIERFNEQLE